MSLFPHLYLVGLFHKCIVVTMHYQITCIIFCDFVKLCFCLYRVLCPFYFPESLLYVFLYPSIFLLICIPFYRLASYSVSFTCNLPYTYIVSCLTLQYLSVTHCVVKLTTLIQILPEGVVQGS